MHNCNNEKVSGTQACQDVKNHSIIPIMVLEDSFKDLERIYLGSQLLKSICNHMMNLLLRLAEKIIFSSFSFLLCGNIMCSMWHSYCIGKVCKTRITNQYSELSWNSISNWRIMSCIFLLTKLVWFYALLLQMEAGISPVHITPLEPRQKIVM